MPGCIPAGFQGDESGIDAKGRRKDNALRRLRVVRSRVNPFVDYSSNQSDSKTASDRIVKAKSPPKLGPKKPTISVVDAKQSQHADAHFSKPRRNQWFKASDRKFSLKQTKKAQHRLETLAAKNRELRREIVWRHAVEEDLKKSEARFRQVAETVGDFIWEIDAKGRYTYASPFVEKILGYTPDELVGKKHFYDLLAPGVRKELKAAFFQAFADRQTFRDFPTSNVSKKGMIVHLESSGSPVLGPSGNLVGYRGVDTDVTERKLVEDRLLESETRFRAIADSAPVLIWTSDTDKLCNFFNKPWLDFTGRTAEQEKGNGWAEGVHPDDLPDCLRTYTKSFDTRQPFTMQYRLRRHDGEYRWFSDSGVPRYDVHGDFVGYIGCCMNIDEQRKDEEEMRRLRQQIWHADRVARTGAITASLAHELNQPLAAILSNAQAGLRFMADENPDLAQIREILGDIVFDDKRAAAVISGLRAMLRRQATSRERISLANAIQETIELLHSELVGRHVDVEMRFEADCTVLADKSQIQQVVLNLVMNSAESMESQPVDQQRLELVLALTPANEAQVAIRDSGPGVSDDMTDKLFDGFWTTKPQGMGIGLPICRSIIESHGGRMWFANNPDRGATFYFILPLEKIAGPGK